MRRLANELKELQDQAQSASGLNVRLAHARGETQRTLRQLAELRLKTQRIQLKLAYLEASRTLGLELRYDLARLPDVNERLRRLRQRQREVAELHGLWLDLIEQRDALADVDAAVRRALAGLSQPADRQRAARQARQLVVSLRAEYAAQVELAEQLLAQLAAWGEAEAALVRSTEELAGLIAEHVLWVPSLPPLGQGDVEQVRLGVAWLWHARRWELLAQTLVRDAADHAWLYALVLAAALWWFWSLGRWRRAVHRIGEEVQAGFGAEFRPTLKAACLTVGLALALPVLLAFVAWRLESGDLEFARSVGRGLRLAAVVLLAAELCRQVCRRRGLAEAHFVWPLESVAVLRRQLRWAIPVSVPLVAAVAALEGAGPAAPELHRSVLGRLLFIGLMCVIAMLFWRVLEPRRGVLAAWAEGSGGAGRATVRHYAAWAASAVPLILTLVSAWGYHYTAIKLAWRMQATVWLVLGLVLVGAVLQRWLLVVRSKLAIAQARADREAAQAALRERQAAAPLAAAAGGPVSLPAAGASQAAGTDAGSFAAASAQSKRLLHGVLSMAALVGLWWIWVDVLPALRYLDRWRLWPNPAYQTAAPDAHPALQAAGNSAAGLRTLPPMASADKPPQDGGDAQGDLSRRPQSGDASAPRASAPAGPSSPQPGEAPQQAAAAQLEEQPGTAAVWHPPHLEYGPMTGRDPDEEHLWITAGDLLTAVVVLLATWIAVRNLPGLLEIALWQRLPLDRGVRYALSSLTRYAIVLGGILLGLSTVGIRWQSVQWLVAAMTVGLAFGLQEIFANFVSGLILLFERPIRPGDVVTVGAVSGIVNRIRIRSTTITDWDRKELIVPNKEFITGQVVNWTLSDPTQRLVLRVGVAYGTDPARAAELLLDVARSDPRVLREPPPSVVFMGFGESSLDFDVRVFLAGPEQIMQVRHDLNVAMEAALRAAGIEIPFPQRVVHLRGAMSSWSGPARAAEAASPSPEGGST